MEECIHFGPSQRPLGFIFGMVIANEEHLQSYAKYLFHIICLLLLFPVSDRVGGLNLRQEITDGKRYKSTTIQASDGNFRHRKNRKSQKSSDPYAGSETKRSRFSGHLYANS